MNYFASFRDTGCRDNKNTVYLTGKYMERAHTTIEVIRTFKIIQG